MKDRPMWLLGAHMSVAGGHALAIERATAFDMTACQIFTKNANQWNAKPIAPDAAESFRAAFGDELERCAQLGVPWLVTHPGAHMGTGVDEGVARVASGLNHLFDELPDMDVTVLLETTAGQGTSLGRSFEELAMILALVEDQTRVGVCLDTCHVFAAGYDLRDVEVYAATMQAFSDTIGLDRLRLFHLNDSKKGLGARVDRHNHIGDGELGTEPFRFLLNDERFAGHPGILETPKGDDGEEDRRNLATLSALVGAADASVIATP